MENRDMRLSRKYLFMKDPRMVCDVKMEGDELDRMTEFKYLGSTGRLERRT